MQGTLLMMVALSGLGCHNKGCDVAYAPPTYSSCFGASYGCYADSYPGPVTPSCYAGCYAGGYSGCYSGGYGGCYSSCYSGCYGGCYGGGCYGGWNGGCGSKHHRRSGGGGLFSCFRKNRCNTGCSSGCDYGYAASSCYASAYAPPIFGSALGMNYTPMTSSQSMMTPSKQWGGSAMSSMPSEVTTPVAPTPATTPAPPAPTTPRGVAPGMEGVTPPPPPAPAGVAPRLGNPPTT